MLRLIRYVTLHQLRTGWARACLVVGGVATGVTLIVAINVVNRSVLGNLRRTIELLAGPAVLEVTLGIGEVGFDEAVATTLRADRDVVAAVPLVRGTIGLADDPAETLDLVGVDLMAEEDLERYQVTTATDRRAILRAMEDTRSILVTEAFARRRGIATGSVLRLSTPAGVGEFVVRGLLGDGGVAAAFDGRLAVMDLYAAQIALLKDGRVDQIDVVARPGTDVTGLQQRLQSALPPSLGVAPPTWRLAQYESALRAFQALLTGLSTLCLVAGIFIVYNTTATAAVHRATMIAGLRLIGADGARLFRLLMLETALLAALGVLVVIPVGVGLAHVIAAMVGDAMGLMFQLRFPVSALAVDAREQGVIACAGVAAALFASAFAARRVTAMEPLAVMRADASATGLQMAPLRLAAAWLLMVATSAGALLVARRSHSIALGNLGATLWDASAIVIAVPVVTWLERPVSRWLARVFGPQGRVAAASLFRSPTRTGVTAAAIALVLTIGLAVSSVTTSFTASLMTYLTRLHDGDLSVSGVSTEGGWLEAPLPREVAAALERMPGVRAVEAARVLSGQLYRGQRIGILAVSDSRLDLEGHPTTWDYREGDPARAGAAAQAGTAVIISTIMSDAFGLRLGDGVELDTPTGLLALPVAGVVTDHSSNRGTVIMSGRLFAARWQDSSVSRLSVSLEPGVSIEQARARILAELGGRFRLKLLSLPQLLVYHRDKLTRAFAFTDAIQLLLVVVTIAGILDLLLSAIFERRRELAVWRLVGATEAAVRRAVVLESVTIGAIASAIGIAVGVVTAWIWIGINVRYSLGYELESHVPLPAAAWYVALITAMTALAGWAAARHATRQRVLDGIRAD